MNRSPRRAMFITGAVWLAVLVIPPMALWQARGRWLERLERPEAQAAWDEFRRDMAGQTGREGPVQRKVPKSLEPPLRVWLRDYFPLAVIAWMSFAGVAGLLLLVLLWGSAAPAPGGGSGSRSAAPRQDDAGPIPGPRTALESGGDPGAASDAGRVGGRGHEEGLR